MTNRYKDIEDDESSLKMLTGLKKAEFVALHSCFERTWTSHFSKFTLDGKPRLRQTAHRSNSIFVETEDALLFGLIYVKNGIVQEELANQFGMDQPKASRYLNLIRKLLSKAATETARGLPDRKRDWLINELSR